MKKSTRKKKVSKKFGFNNKVYYIIYMRNKFNKEIEE